MEIQRLGVMKSEFRKSVAEAFKGFLGVPWLSETIDAGFGLRTSGFIRHSELGIRICTIAWFVRNSRFMTPVCLRVQTNPGNWLQAHLG